MKRDFLRRFAGLPVIVQFREAIAMGAVDGPAYPAPRFNEKGDALMQDGSVAPADVKLEDLAKMPAWHTRLAEQPTGAPVFQFAIPNALIIVGDKPDDDCVQVHYFEGQNRLHVTVDPEFIIAVTVVAEGPFPKEESRIVLSS